MFRFWFAARAAVLGGVLAASATCTFAQEVIPDFYKDPGLYPNRSYVNQNFSEHIDPFTGSLQLHYVDVHLPGDGGFDLKVVRSYNSASIDPTNPATAEGYAGIGWTIHFGRVLKTKNTTICTNANALSVIDNPTLELPDGGRQLLAFTGSTSPLALTTQRWRADCNGASLGMNIFSPDGTRYDMTQLVNIGSATAPVFAWYTTKITDRNGNTATINYAATASPEITSVTTNDGRRITFNYADSGALTRRITSITGAANQTYSYGYTAVSGVAGKFFLTSVTRPGGTKWEYDYNASLGNSAGSFVIKKLAYPENGSITYTYDFVFFDSQANPLSRSTVVKTKTVSTSGTWNFAYDPGGPGALDTTTVTQPASAGTITYRHAGPNFTTSGNVWMVGLLMSKQYGSTQTETLEWDKQKISNENYLRPGAFVTKVDSAATNAPVLSKRTITRDGATYTTDFSSFDEFGNPRSVTESGPNGGSRTKTLTYFTSATKWIVNQLENETVTGGVAITRDFDTNGNLRSVTRDGVVTSYLYDGDGNVSQATLPRNLAHGYTSYKQGIPQSETQQEGVSISRVVSSAGNVTSETDGEGSTRTFTYDGLNRLTGVTYPKGDPLNIAYGVTTKTATRGALVETTNFDGFGRPTTVTLGGITRTYRYDALGRLTFESNPGNASAGTTYAYDVLNRVIRVTFPDGTSQTISHGAGTRSVRDERANTTTYAFRSYGSPDEQYLVRVTAPAAAASVTITRDSKDLVRTVLQDGTQRTYGYDTRGYLTTVTNPENGTTSYGRDDAGNMSTRTVSTAGTTVYGYDGLNRLTRVTYPGTTPAVTNTYSKTNKMRTVTSSVSTMTYGYDTNDNLVAATTAIDGLTFTTTYGYNTRDQLATITYPRTGTVVDYAPDALGRPTQVSGFVNTVTYHPSGQVNEITYANGTTTTYGQNSRLLLSSFATKAGSTTLLGMTYGYDEAGNLNTVSGATDASYNRTLGYDAVNRLTSAAGPWGAGTIAYSGTGNITSQTFGSYNLAYTYDTQNRMSSISGARSLGFTYDGHGNIASGFGSNYTYDGVPNLTCVDCDRPQFKVEHTYNGLNQRATVTRAGAKTYEIYDPQGNLLVEHSPTALFGKTTEQIYLGPHRVAQRLSEGGDTLTLSIGRRQPIDNFGPSGTSVTFQVSTNPTGKPIVVKDNGVVVGTVVYQPPVCQPGRVCVPVLAVPITSTVTGAGVHTITAEFAGDATHAPAKATDTFQVTQ